MAGTSTKTDAEKAAAKDATYANGLRKAREEKGYGRVQIAKALEITTSAWWKLETTAEGKELKDTLAAIKALPTAVKPAREKKAATKAPAKKAAAKATAKPKAKPAEATDLI